MTTLSDNNLLIRTSNEITQEWLRAVLNRPSATLLSVERVGTGQMSIALRVSYSDNGTAGSVIAKIAAEDEVSRNTGVGLGAYLREVTFYRNVRDRIGGPLPACYAAEYDTAEGFFTLVLQDAVGAHQGDQIAGCDAETAEVAIRALARIHAAVWDDDEVGNDAPFAGSQSRMNSALMEALLPDFFERYDSRITEEHKDVIRRFAAAADAHNANRSGPYGLVHADFRLDNILFGGQANCLVVDWQSVQWGKSIIDAAYFIGGALPVEQRRLHEERLVQIYHQTLLATGVTDYGWEQCWQEYRREVFWSIAMVLVPSMFVQQTERGDEMFMTWLARACQQALDLGSVALLPAL